MLSVGAGATVSFDYLPSDIKKCTVLVDGKILWKVEIGSTKLTADPLNTN